MGMGKGRVAQMKKGSIMLWVAVCWAGAQVGPSEAPPSLPSVSAAPPVAIVPPPPQYRFPDGQTYVYGVEWHLFNAGTARLNLEDEGREQHVTASAVSAGVVNSLYKVNDQFEAFFDPHRFCSQKILKHVEEGSRARQSELSFEYTRGKSVYNERNLKTGEEKHRENDIPDCVTDVVSGFYYLSSLPLQVGSTYVFQINDGGRTNEVRAYVETRERVKVPAGSFQAVRVRADAISGMMKGKGTVWAWFTEDVSHTPVQMRSKLGWGTLLFRLQGIEHQ